MSSHVSASSIATSTDAEDLWQSNSPAEHVDLRQGSLSLSPNPNIELSNARMSTHSDTTVRRSSFFQSPYDSNGPSSLWPANNTLLRPCPTSPSLMNSPNQSSDYANMQSPILQNSTPAQASRVSSESILSQYAFGQRSISQPLPSPSSTSICSNAPRASMSPAQSVGRIAPKNKPSASANEKKKKTKPRRTAHNAIEKRYRIRLNDKIAELRDSIPSLRMQSGAGYDGVQSDEFLDPRSEGVSMIKVKKSNVLEKATEYVKHLESCNRRLEAELNRILSLSLMNNLGGQAQSLPSNYSIMENSYSIQPSALPRNHASEHCSYPVRDHLSEGGLLR